MLAQVRELERVQVLELELELELEPEPEPEPEPERVRVLALVRERVQVLAQAWELGQEPVQERGRVQALGQARELGLERVQALGLVLVLGQVLELEPARERVPALAQAVGPLPLVRALQRVSRQAGLLHWIQGQLRFRCLHLRHTRPVPSETESSALREQQGCVLAHWVQVVWDQGCRSNFQRLYQRLRVHPGVCCEEMTTCCIPMKLIFGITTVRPVIKNTPIKFSGNFGRKM